MAMVIATTRKQSRRDVMSLREGSGREFLICATSDIFGALLGNQARWPYGKHDEEQRKYRDIDQSGIKKLGGVAFDQTDDQPGDNRSFDIAKTADDHNREGFDDHRDRKSVV